MNNKEVNGWVIILLGIFVVGGLLGILIGKEIEKNKQNTIHLQVLHTNDNQTIIEVLDARDMALRVLCSVKYEDQQFREFGLASTTGTEKCYPTTGIYR